MPGIATGDPSNEIEGSNKPQGLAGQGLSAESNNKTLYLLRLGLTFVSDTVQAQCLLLVFLFDLIKLLGSGSDWELNGCWL